MTQNEALTYGAVAFAAFTLFYVFRKTPSKAVAAQPGQQQRDAGLADWLAIQDTARNAFTMEQGVNHYRPFVGQFGI